MLNRIKKRKKSKGDAFALVFIATLSEWESIRAGLTSFALVSFLSVPPPARLSLTLFPSYFITQPATTTWKVLLAQLNMYVSRYKDAKHEGDITGSFLSSYTEDGNEIKYW